MLSIIQSESGVLIKNVWILTKLGRCGKECSDIHPKYYFVWSWPAGGATWQAFWQMRVFAVLGWKLRGSDCGKNLLVTVRTLVLTSAVMYMRPLLSVWSVPHRLGTLATQRLWMFIIQSGGRHREKCQVQSYSIFYMIQSQFDGSTYVHISCPGV